MTITTNCAAKNDPLFSQSPLKTPKTSDNAMCEVSVKNRIQFKSIFNLCEMSYFIFSMGSLCNLWHGGLLAIRLLVGQTNDVSPEWLEFYPQNKILTIDVDISLPIFQSFGFQKCFKNYTLNCTFCISEPYGSLQNKK